MTDKEFVSCIRREILERHVEAYRSILASKTPDGDPRQKLYPQMMAFYLSLTEDQRNEFVVVIRQVIVDTLSLVLGALDGSSLIATFGGEDFHLTYSDDTQQLNGDLQDIFLEAEQLLQDQTDNSKRPKGR